MVFINNQLLRNIESSKVKRFTAHPVQYFSQASLKEFKSEIINVLNSEYAGRYISSAYRHNTSINPIVDEDNLRLWLLDPQFTLPQTFSKIKEHCEKSTSFDYAFSFRGKYMEKKAESTLENADIAENDYLFIEINEIGSEWNFVHADIPVIKKCEGCEKYTLLKYSCVCANVRKLIVCNKK